MRKLLLALLSLALTSSVGAQSCCDSRKPYQPVFMYSCAVPVGLAPSGTMGANGALTSGTALPETYSSGIWLYFPAGAVSSGSAAGFYWTVMTNTTAGTVYTNTVDPSTGGNVCSTPASPTAVSDAGPGAYTGVTSSTITMMSTYIPGGLMGLHGRIVASWGWWLTNNANTKTGSASYGGTELFSRSNSSVVGVKDCVIIHNRGAVNKQISVGSSSACAGGSGAAPLTGTVASGSQQLFAVRANRGTATDNFILVGLIAEVYFD